MKRLALIAAAGLCAASPALAQVAPAQQQPRTHVVRRGDTLWDLARQYLSDPFLWPEIFRINPDVIRDPARIYPAERLRLPGAGEGFIAIESEPGEGRTVFYPRETEQRAGGPIVRPAGTADVPVLTPGDFYRAGFLAPDAEVRSIGRLAELEAPTVVPLAMTPQIQLYDRVYVTLAAGDAAQVGDRIHFLRRGRAVKQYGRIWESTGLATVAAIEGNVATAVVVQMFDAVAVGDLAVPAARFPVPAGVAPTPEAGMEARVVAFQNAHPVQMTQEIVFVDVGQQSGVAAGDEFLAYLPARQQRWGRRPEIDVARLQVVRVAGRTASARILAMEHPALEPGVPVRRVSRMP
ncbi:MAG TPA: LysM peptidoglycan-binding domain-containing protein [Longimicrobiaceae bacterium]|nr:LysM peptidoglycan-binding domain-containing protein [Longimicrobiaceae bacterium]